jgi:hypothetical protein
LFIAASATDRWRVVILSLPVSHQQQAIFNLVTINLATINLATINLGRRRWPENRRRRSTIPAPSDQFIPARSCLPDHSHPVIHTRLFIPVPSRSGRQSRHLRTVTKALD